MTATSKVKYVLAHLHAQGVTINVFEYIPTEEQPYPDIMRVARLLELEIDITEDELDITPITKDWVSGTFNAKEAGTDELETFVGPTQMSEWYDA